MKDCDCEAMVLFGIIMSMGAEVMGLKDCMVAFSGAPSSSAAFLFLFMLTSPGTVCGVSTAQSETSSTGDESVA